MTENDDFYNLVYEFLKKNYRHSRFEGRNGVCWGLDYSHNITRSHINTLEKYGVSFVSRFEDKTGRGFMFRIDLCPDYGKEVEYHVNSGRLTHLF